MQTLTSFAEYEQLQKENNDWILFKHSPTCSRSMRAYQVITSIENQLTKTVYMLNVLQTADTKHRIADLLHIQHESPQVIFFHNGNQVRHASHEAITQERLLEDTE